MIGIHFPENTEIGLFFAQGVSGFRKDMRAASLWFDKALKLDHPLVYFQVALLYLSGKYIKKNSVFAIKLMRLSAYRGHKPAIGFLIEGGYLVFSAPIVPPDHTDAMRVEPTIR